MALASAFRRTESEGLAENAGTVRKKIAKNLVFIKKNHLQSKIFYAILTKLFTRETCEQENRGVTVGHVLK